MFTKFRLQNYRTHIDTTLELKDVTLIIGSNNSGKSNLLSGLSYFSMLVSAAYPGSKKSKTLGSGNYFPHRHSLSGRDVPISFYCEWERNPQKIEYELQIYPFNQRSDIGCRERITIYTGARKEFKHGHTEASEDMLLRTQLEDEDLTPDEKELTDTFFRSLASVYYYHFQPAMLKGYARPIADRTSQLKDYSAEFKKTGKKPNLASEIGREGANFQALLRYVQEHEQVTYNKFLGYLKRFVKSFNGIIVDKGVTKWQFDMGSSDFPYFESDKVSDGLVKAGAIALLCAMQRPPALIMIEEIENGINQKNLSEFLGWLFGISDHGRNTQFILTSHSPSVIREFSDRLDAVYNLHLRERDYRSIATNLNDAIKPLVNMGTIEEENRIVRDGKEVIQVKPYRLTELFYNGVLGEL